MEKPNEQISMLHKLKRTYKIHTVNNALGDGSQGVSDVCKK